MPRKKTGSRKTTARRKKAAHARAAGKKAAAKKKAAPRKKTAARKKAAVRKKSTPGKAAVRRKTGTRTRAATTARKPAPRPRALARPSLTVEVNAAAAWRMRRQGLQQPTLRAPHQIAAALLRSGWLETPVGPTPYVALAARYAAFARHELDRAVFQEGTAVELPAVRGAAMLVPVEDAWIALQAHAPRNLARLRDLLTRRRVMTRAALMNLEDVVRAVLAGRPLPAQQLRERIPARLVKVLGPAGERHGLETTVDLALWDLVASGDVICRPAERRLDRPRTEFILRRDLAGPVVAADVRPRPRELFIRALAARYFAWLGPARLQDFTWWSDATPAEARRAAAELGLAAVRLKGLKGTWFLHTRDLDLLSAYTPPEPPGVALVPARDALVGWWSSPEPLAEAADLKRTLLARDEGRTAGPVGLQHHPILVGGRVAGAWELGGDGVLRYAIFRELPAHLEDLVNLRAAAMAEFLRRELGDPPGATDGEERGPSLVEAARGWPGRAASINIRA